MPCKQDHVFLWPCACRQRPCWLVARQECKGTDWAYLGQLDAMDGKLDINTRVKRHFKTCKNNGVQMDVHDLQLELVQLKLKLAP